MLHLTAQAKSHGKTSLGDIIRRYRSVPYGWSDYDTEATVARRVVAQSLAVWYRGQGLAAGDSRMLKCLTSNRGWCGEAHEERGSGLPGRFRGS